MKKFNTFLNEGKRENKINKITKKIRKFLNNEKIIDFLVDKVVDKDSLKGTKYLVWFANLIKEHIASDKHALKNEFMNYISNGGFTVNQKSFDNNIDYYLNIDLDDMIGRVLDWLKSDLREGEVNLNDYKTLKSAVKASDDWHKSLKASGVIKDETGKVIMEFDDGYYWIDLQTTNCKAEAEAMGHCGMTNNGTTIYSLRDSKKSPHVTVAIDVKEGIIYQMKGKENKKPVEKYHKYIYEFLMEQDIEKFSYEYDQSQDFNVMDLDKEHFEKIFEKKPDLVIKSLNESIDLFLEISRTDYISREELIKIMDDVKFSKSELIAYYLLEILKGDEIFSVDELKKFNYKSQLNQIGNLLLWYYGIMDDKTFHQYFTEYTIYENGKVKMFCYKNTDLIEKHLEKINKDFPFTYGVDDENNEIIIFNEFPLKIKDVVLGAYDDWQVYSEDEVYSGEGFFDFDPWEDDIYNDLETLFLNMIEGNEKYFVKKLNESPNYIKYAGRVHSMCVGNDVTFIYRKNKIYSDIGCDAHDNVASRHNLRKYDRYGDISGRYFVEPGVLTFWKYPKDYEELKKVIEGINKEYSSINIILDDDTILEIPHDVNKDFEDGDKSNYIKVKDYKQDYKHSDKTMNIIHNLPATQKRKALMDSGYRSKVSKWKDWQKPFESKNYQPRKFDDMVLLIEDMFGGFSFVLLNTKTDVVIGTLNLVVYDDINDKEYFGMVTSVGAERGYGKYLYEFALMYVDVPVMPSRDGDVTGEAMNVWEKLYNDSDVVKDTLKWEDDEFTLSILFGEKEYYSLEEKEEIYKEYLENGEDLKKDEEIKIFNTKYSINKESDLYLELKDKGRKFDKDTDKYFDVDYSGFFEPYGNLNESISNIKTIKYSAIKNDHKGKPELYVTNYKIVKVYDDKVECHVRGYEYTDIHLNDKVKKGWIDVNDFETGERHILYKKDFTDGDVRKKIYNIK